jgi:hypothetical protein
MDGLLWEVFDVSLKDSVTPGSGDRIRISWSAGPNNRCLGHWFGQYLGRGCVLCIVTLAIVYQQ